MATEHEPANPLPEPRKEQVDRERKKSADRSDVDERGPDTGSGKLIPRDNR